MFEKFFLAIAITFSLNVFLQVRLPIEANAVSNSHHLQADSSILAEIINKDE